MIIGLKYNQKVNPSSLHPEIGEFFNEENLPLWDYPIKLMELVTTSRHPRDKICNLRAASDEIRRVLSTFKAFLFLLLLLLLFKILFFVF